jgi:ParB-like chromosome segregation protein Spo0J
MQIELQELELRYAALRVNDTARAARMRASLAAHGQQSPVAVIEADGGGDLRYVLIDGYVRVSAARTLARDCVDAVLLALREPDALIMTHRLDEVGRRSALEEGWLLDELIIRHGLTQQELGKRLSRSKSWVCRRLSLVCVLPESTQRAVRDAVLPAQGAMKYLVPLSRDNRSACERITKNLGTESVTVRELGRLYACWRKSHAEQRERIEAQPRLFLRVDESLQADERSDTECLTRDFQAISGLCVRARRRLVDGQVELSRRRLHRAFREAQRGFSTLTELMLEDNDARPVHAHGDSAVVEGGPRNPDDRQSAGPVS